MSSSLIITPVERLQRELLRAAAFTQNSPTVFVSLNKPSHVILTELEKAKIARPSLFFIDCVARSPDTKDALYLPPRDLDLLLYALSSFLRYLPSGQRFIMIDSLATLLIYNEANKVAAFVNSLTTLASVQNTHIIALSQATSGEDLLGKIYNFFDEVKKFFNEAGK